MEEFYFTFGVQYRTNPHPSVVDGVRPDRLMGIGLNMYDVMARGRRRGGRCDGG